MNNNRGSEWRKWDLHVHTPASFFFKEPGKKLRDMSQEERKVAMKKFIDVVNDSDVAVFCLMDYWTFDWYLALRDYLVDNPMELKKTIFPGMELRIESPTSYRLNIHCILSDNLTRQELIDFKSELYIRSIDKKLSDDALIQFAKSLDKSKAQIHGYDDPQSLSNEKLLLLGSQTAEITKDSMRQAFNQIPAGTGYVIMPYDTSDGLLKLNWKDHPHDDNYFMQSSQIFETRDQVNIDLFNGVKTDANKDFFENFYKTLGNQPKPCISGSDAHKYSDYGKYPSNRITWIKADPTFEGLKQIIFEPEQRVKIQQEKPDFKEDKLIIDQVRFVSSNDKFTPEPICLNENLNVIIGGKSSGKSILLYSIAKTLLGDREFFTKEGIQNKYKFEGDEFDFIIKTKGGFEQSIHRKENENSVISDIKYIPQNYLVKLAEPEINKSGDSLNKIIRELIKEDEDAKNSYEAFIAAVKSNDKKRENIIDSYFEIKSRIVDLEAQLKLKPKVEILESNIATNTKKVEELNKSVGMTPEQIAKYNELQKKLENIQAERTVANDDFKKIEKHNTEAVDILNNLKTKHSLLANSLRNEKLKGLYDSANSEIETLLATFNEIASKIETVTTDTVRTFKNQSEVSKVFSDLSGQKKEVDLQIEPYLKNEVVKKQIEEISKSINDDKVSLQTITQLTKEVTDSKTALANEKEKLFLLYETNLQEYNTVVSQLKIRTNELEKDDGLKITGQIKFNFPKFREKFLPTNHGKYKSYEGYYICKDDKNGLAEYKLSDILSDLQAIFDGIIAGSYVLKGDNKDRENAIKLLLKDYFFDYWLIEYKKDKLGEMSTGKASFVILMLIVGLSKSKAPILIDQPEDNLDNRSITTELVTYLRNKKTERQIILVTHNPNVVVNADAENIIVANQKTQNDTVSTSVYLFDYINGAIENTFSKIDTEHDLLKSMGIREHIAEIVEGGKDAFKKREEKYGF